MVVAMVLYMRPTMATSPHKTYYGKDPEVDCTKEVLEVLKNRVLPSLIEASESSIKKGCVERITIDLRTTVRSIQGKDKDHKQQQQPLRGTGIRHENRASRKPTGE
jgi:hypothetical protein